MPNYSSCKPPDTARWKRTATPLLTDPLLTDPLLTEPRLTEPRPKEADLRPTSDKTIGLKHGLNPRANELGIYFCGGRGKHSRRTVLAESTNLPGDSLVRSIRLTAKIDNNVIANVLRGALDRAKIGDTDKIAGFPRLNQFVQAVEKRCETTADFDQLVAHEHSIFTSLNGRSVFDDRNKTRRPARSGKQLSLF